MLLCSCGISSSGNTYSVHWTFIIVSRVLDHPSNKEEAKTGSLPSNLYDIVGDIVETHGMIQRVKKKKSDILLPHPVY